MIFNIVQNNIYFFQGNSKNSNTCNKWNFKNSNWKVFKASLQCKKWTHQAHYKKSKITSPSCSSSPSHSGSSANLLKQRGRRTWRTTGRVFLPSARNWKILKWAKLESSSRSRILQVGYLLWKGRLMIYFQALLHLCWVFVLIFSCSRCPARVWKRESVWAAKWDLSEKWWGLW